MDPLLISLFIFLFLLSAFFSGTEIALMSLPSHKIDSLLKQNKFGALALKYIKDRNDKLLITILIGNNLVNVYTASLATQISIGFAESSGIEQSLAIGISTGVVTFLLLMFGEIAPKSFATKNAESISLYVAKIYKFLMLILYPVVFLIECLIKIFTGKSKVNDITGEEIEAFIDMGKNSGTLEDAEHEKIKNILEFNNIFVDEIMTPRVKIDALSSDTTLKEAKEFYINHTHSRIPVYTDTIDKIDNILTIREILKEIEKGNEDKKLSEIELQKVIKVPLNQPIDNLLETFKKAHKHLAIIIDEYGGVAGLITLEDIIEEVFGEIRDETDKEIDEIKQINDNNFIVDPSVSIENILKELDLELKDIGLDEKEFDGETISYVITHQLERFPNTGEIIDFQYTIMNDDEEKNGIVEFKVLEINSGKIEKVEVVKK